MFIPDWVQVFDSSQYKRLKKCKEDNIPWEKTFQQSDSKSLSVDQGQFSTALRNAEILDHKAVQLPGSLVVLPYGVRLIEQFANIVNEEYQKNGLIEYRYPVVTPQSTFDPQQVFFNLEDKLLFIGTKGNFSKGTPRAALCPTGEAQIYSHWNKIVSSPQDLPIKMYQRTSYFRPNSSGKHSGNGVFRSMEAGDVFEFHTAYSKEEEATKSVVDYYRMLQSITRRCYVPTLWSVRPPWTNHHEVAEWSIGGDVPLPIGSTVQTATLYYQGTIFSKAYKVGYKVNGKMVYTHQVVGAITRRLLLAHLFLGMENGQFLIHPDLSPDQVRIVYKKGVESADHINDLTLFLKHHGIRCSIQKGTNSKESKRLRKINRLQGVPIEVFLLGKRSESDPFKIILRRSDTDEEAVLYKDTLGSLIDIIRPILSNIGISYQEKVQQFFLKQCISSSIDSLADVLEAKKVAVCPLTANKDTCLHIEKLCKGEVLGYTYAKESNPCVLTGNMVNTIAYISKRI